MIPRTVKRMFDERLEPRESANASALIEWRDTTVEVELVSISPSGAMVVWDEIPHIGEKMALLMPDRGPVGGVVRWVRDGRIGIHFAVALK